jgi:cytochrome c oxidase cbb3-type subunit 3
MYSRCRSSLIALLVAAAVLSAGCQREQRAFAVEPPSDAPPPTTAMNTVLGDTADLAFREQQQRTYEDNAYQVSQGEQQYSAFNCVGCHAHGGGDVGPALMDDKWIYGGEIDQIYLSIAQGRANGMPAFGAMIPSQQIWQIAAYVRSMGGHGAKSARANRSDHMSMPVPAEAPAKPLRNVQRDDS